MKILGKKSLSSVVMLFICVLLILCIIAIVAGGIFVLSNASFFTKDLLSITYILIYVSAIPALVMIIAFLQIFNTLKKENPFEKKNIKRLGTSCIASIVIGVIYAINVLLIYLGVGMVQERFFIIYPLANVAISIIFLVFGIGIVVLKEIYRKAIEYKDENDLTI